MKKLTKNQEVVFSCLTNEYLQLKDICDKYANIQGTGGLSSWGYVWKTTISTVLNSLIKNNLVEYEYRGKYRILNKEK